MHAVRDMGEGIATLESLEALLKRRYWLAVCEPGFSESLYRVAQELAETAEAGVHPRREVRRLRATGSLSYGAHRAGAEGSS